LRANLTIYDFCNFLHWNLQLSLGSKQSPNSVNLLSSIF